MKSHVPWICHACASPSCLVLWSGQSSGPGAPQGCVGVRRAELAHPYSRGAHNATASVAGHLISGGLRLLARSAAALAHVRVSEATVPKPQTNGVQSGRGAAHGRCARCASAVTEGGLWQALYRGPSMPSWLPHGCTSTAGGRAGDNAGASALAGACPPSRHLADRELLSGSPLDDRRLLVHL